MGKTAIIKTPGDQSIQIKEITALNNLIKDLILKHNVTDFAVSCIDDANVASLRILKLLETAYPDISISIYHYNDNLYRSLMEKADVVILTYGCTTCHWTDKCCIYNNLNSFIGNQERYYMSDYYHGPKPFTISCLPATLLKNKTILHRGENYENTRAC